MKTIIIRVGHVITIAIVCLELLKQSSDVKGTEHAHAYAQVEAIKTVPFRSHKFMASDLGSF